MASGQVSYRGGLPLVNNMNQARHLLGFLGSGGTAFLVDAGITLLLTQAGLSPFIARLIAIAVAMVVAWLMHRRFTFAVSEPPSVRELLKFSAVAWSANALNYGIYAAVLVIWPALWPLAAMVLSTAVAMMFSYAGFRLGVFRKSPPET